MALKKNNFIKTKTKPVTLNLINIRCQKQGNKLKKNLKKYISNEKCKKSFELSKVRVEEEARYLGVKRKRHRSIPKLLSYLIIQNPLKKLQIQKKPDTYYVRDL